MSFVCFCTIRSECSSLRALLNKQHEDGQHAALEQLSTLKEKEKDEISQNSEKNIAILQSKVLRYLPKPMVIPYQNFTCNFTCQKHGIGTFRI